MSKVNYMIPFSIDYMDSIVLGRFILILLLILLARICVKVNLINFGQDF